MKFKNLNIWFVFSLLISLTVIIPILTVFSSFFENTTNYFEILKNTFLFEYTVNSICLLISVLFITFIIGTGAAYLVSFYEFPLSNFFKWALENKVISYIEEHYAIIEQDMNKRNSTSKRNAMPLNNSSTKTRKKREELSV